MRQIVLDTETTGLEPKDGHRIIEIGCVELINRRFTGKHLHYYTNPQRQIEAGALAVHGIDNQFLLDKPLFKDIAHELVQFIEGAELIIHNAPFDIGFLEHEFTLSGHSLKTIKDYCAVVDTLAMARKLHPGQKNNLDALCKRYQVDNAQRDKHGALLDARILAHVYLAMTGGQMNLFENTTGQHATSITEHHNSKVKLENPLSVHVATAEELQAHKDYLAKMKETKGQCVWE